MTFSSILAAISGVSAIIGGVVYIVKMLNRYINKTPAEVHRDILDKNEADRRKAEETGRPV